MLAEFVKAIQGLTQKGIEPRIMEIPGKEELLVAYPDGTHEFLDKEWYDQSALHDWTSVVNFLDDAQSLEVVYHHYEGGLMGKVHILTDPHGRERRTHNLYSTEIFESFAGLAGGKMFSQSDVVDFFRVELAGAVPESTHNLFARVQFETGTRTSGDVGRHAETLGKQVTSKIDSALEIPEVIPVSFQVYKDHFLNARCRQEIFVDIDKQRASFRLDLPPDAISDCQQQAHNQIQEKLVKAIGDRSVPVYCGYPSFVAH